MTAKKLLKKSAAVVAMAGLAAGAAVAASVVPPNQRHAFTHALGHNGEKVVKDLWRWANE